MGAPRSVRGGLRSRHLPPHLSCGFILAQPFVNDLPEQAVFGPGQELHLGDQFRPHPMHAAEHERRSEPGCLLYTSDAADAAGINQLSVRIVVPEQQGAEIRPSSFRLVPADDDKFRPVEAFGGRS